MNLNYLRFVDAKATDEIGKELPVRFGTRPDSKYGPYASIGVTPGTENRITITARLEYSGQPITVNADFIKDASGSWRSMGVILRNVEQVRVIEKNTD